MPLARIGDTLIYFAHIPKTGGGSIVQYLESKGQVALNHPMRLKWSATTVQHMDAKVHERYVPTNFYDFSFAVLRDPLARLMSEFRYQRSRMETTLEFGDWAELMLQTVRLDPYCWDNHIRPQTDFLAPKTHLFRFEEGLEHVFDWIDEVSNTPASPRDSRKNATVQSEIGFDESIGLELQKYYAGDFELMAEFDIRGQPGIQLRNLAKKP